jgi:tetratricopeptide (TPR) repeat protein
METIIEGCPDSVLNVLQAIDTDELIGDEERAKHALLLSMALDKNVIDKTDFEVLQPAIDYYEDNGSATDKLRTYYYQARIYQNAGNDAAAMECFVKALFEGDVSEDLKTKARAHYTKALIYGYIYDYDNSIEDFLKAASLYKESGLNEDYINCQLMIINRYTLKNDYSAALPYIDECKQLIGSMSIKRLCQFYSIYILYTLGCGSDDDIKDVIVEYRNTIPEEYLDWLTLARAYYNLGEYEDALQSITRCENTDGTYYEIKHKALISMIYEKLGKHEEALSAYKKYMAAADKKSWSILNQDTNFIEERHALEMAKAKETEAKNKRTIAILVCIVALIGSLLVIMIIRSRLLVSRNSNILLESEKAHYEQMYNEVVAERDALNEMIANNTIKEEAMDVIKKRLGVLNTIIVSHLSAKDTDIKRANEELEHLIANRNDFIKSTRLTLEENYPHFFAYLKDKGLEEFEIDFCCLYAIGLKGKEIKAYTNLTRHYKDSSEVRQKLGLSESDTNLSNFLQKLLKKEGE